MECKDGVRRSPSSYKPSKFEEEEEAGNARSSSYKAKDVRRCQNESDEIRVQRRTDYPSEAKPESAIGAVGSKEEKEEISSRWKAAIAGTIDFIQEEKADTEFEELMRKPSTGGEVTIPTDPEAINVLNGFKM